MKRPRRKPKPSPARKAPAGGKTTARRKKTAARVAPKAIRAGDPGKAGDAAGPPGPTLRSQSQLEIRMGHGARPLSAIEQAARLASARMERRIGRLLSRRVKLKFR